MGGLFGQGGIPIEALLLELGNATVSVLRRPRYVMLLLVYAVYMVLMRVARDFSTPAAALLGPGGCYPSSDSSNSGRDDPVGGSSAGTAGWSLLHVITSLVSSVLAYVRAVVCRELGAACDRGVWYAQDCRALFQSPV